MEGSGDSPGHKAQGQKVQAIVSPEAADLAQQEESARWDNNSNDNDDNESWRAEFDAAALKSSSHKRWKEERRIRQQEKQSISNYLRSIDRDARFVADFCNQPKFQDFPVVANLRNGLWYAPPTAFTGGTCYFRSKDGHTRCWNFELRRLNLPFAATVASHRGAIVVDSTRRGKDFPDSFLKTIPIWCAVLNRFLFGVQSRDLTDNDARAAAPDSSLLGHSCPSQASSIASDSFALHVHPSVPPEEAAMIEELLPRWEQSLRDFVARSPVIEAELGRLRRVLRKPLRPLFFRPTESIASSLLSPSGGGSASADNGDESDSPHWTENLPFVPVVLLSASASAITRMDFRHLGHSWTYIPGAGDDEEHWASPIGLTSKMFWEHRNNFEQFFGDGDEESVRELIASLGQSRNKSTIGVDAERTHMRDPSDQLELLAVIGDTGIRLLRTEQNGTVGTMQASMLSGSTEACKNPLLIDIRPDTDNDAMGEEVASGTIASAGSGSSGARCLLVPIRLGKRTNAADYWQAVVFPRVLAALHQCYTVWLDKIGLAQEAGGRTHSEAPPVVHVIVSSGQEDCGVVVCVAILLAFWQVDLKDVQRQMFTGTTHSINDDTENETFSKGEVRDMVATIQNFHQQPALPKRLIKELSNYFGQCGGWRAWRPPGVELPSVTNDTGAVAMLRAREDNSDKNSQ